MARKAKQPSDFDGIHVPVNFGNFSDGDPYVGLPFSVSRSKFTSKQAEKFFCGARLAVTIVRDPNAADDTPGQEPLADPDPEDTIEAEVDVKGYRAGRKAFAAKLTFNREGIDCKRLLDFSRSAGWIRAERIGDVEDGRKKRSEATDGADEDDDRQGRLGLHAK